MNNNLTKKYLFVLEEELPVQFLESSLEVEHLDYSGQYRVYVDEFYGESEVLFPPRS